MKLGKDVKVLKSIDLKPVTFEKQLADTPALCLTLTLQDGSQGDLTTVQAVFHAFEWPAILRSLREQSNRIAESQTPKTDTPH